MKDNTYGKSANMAMQAIKYLKKEDSKKVPISFLTFLNSMSDSEKVEPDEYPEFEKKSKELLGFMYITWICNEDDFQKYRETILENTNKLYDIKKYKESLQDPNKYYNCDYANEYLDSKNNMESSVLKECENDGIEAYKTIGEKYKNYLKSLEIFKSVENIKVTSDGVNYSMERYIKIKGRKEVSKYKDFLKTKNCEIVLEQKRRSIYGRQPRQIINFT